MDVGRASSTSSLDRRTLKIASCESDRCLALRESTRHSVSQTRSYSTYSVGGRPIWENGIYSGSGNGNNKGYSRGAEIFRAMDAMKAKEKETAAKANNSISKTKE